MNNKTALGCAILAVIINGLIGHFFAPNGITFTPIVLTITSMLVVFGTNRMNVFIMSILTFLFVSLNDISIKLYSGGSNDREGLGWVHMFLFIGLIPTFIILLIGIFRRKEENITNKLIACGLFVALVLIYLVLFGELGLGRYYWYSWNG